MDQLGVREAPVAVINVALHKVRSDNQALMRYVAAGKKLLRLENHCKPVQCQCSRDASTIKETRACLGCNVLLGEVFPTLRSS